MKTIDLTENEFKILRVIIQNDIANLAQEEDFFEQTKYDPKEYIDERISLSKQFNLDFWKVVELYCSDVELERLKALYNGKTIREFYENYTLPNESHLQKKFLRSLIEGKNNQ